jgi:hypothetical protein
MAWIGVRSFLRACALALSLIEVACLGTLGIRWAAHVWTLGELEAEAQAEPLVVSERTDDDWLMHLFDSGDRAPAVGRPAPEFTLKDLRTGRPVALADYRGRKPVFLVFGSFSCEQFCNGLKELRDLQTDCRDLVEFLFVYVGGDYHPNTELDAALVRTGYASGTSAPLRARIRLGLDLYALNMPCLTGASDGLLFRYGGWPSRAFLINRDGRIAWDSGRGLLKPLDYGAARHHLWAVLAD